MEQLDGRSKNIVGANIEKMKELFPEVFTEGKIDFQQLQEVLGEYVEDKDERYRFEWHGKSKALRLSQTPSTGTLRPCKEESKNWDTTQNLYIEGDNLEVLKLLQKTYHNKIKMIYIDPPYNTGKDFVYPDNYRDNLRNYLEITGQLDKEGKKVSTNKEGSGRYHTDWLNMLYPRLRLARNLLEDEGVIFISIDDTEVANLRKVCDEIFGENNFVSNIVWQKKYSPQNDAKYFSDMHDHILCYAKKKKNKAMDIGWDRYLLPRSEEQNSRYKNPDDDPRGPWKSSDFSVKTYSANYDFEIIVPSGRKVVPPASRCWWTSKEKFEELVVDDRIWFGKEGDNVPSLKKFLSEVQAGSVPVTWWKREDVGDNQKASNELKDIFDDERPFDTPKPIELVKRMLMLSCRADDIVLDFFSGSATTAHAIIDNNLNQINSCSFIMVQLPERIIGGRTGIGNYSTICEIGKERIRRAGEKIVAENQDKEGIEDLDIGFKVFKLDSSNLKKWNPDYEELGFTLDAMVNNMLDGRTEEDMLYEVMLKFGVDLTHPIDEFNVNGKHIFSIGFGAMFACLDDDITIEVAEEIVRKRDELQPEITRVVFKDNGFVDDSAKVNTVQVLKRNGIQEVMSI